MQVNKIIKGLNPDHKSAFFSVEERPVFVDNRQVENKKAIVRQDTGDVFSIMSKNYKPVSNKQVLESFAEIAEEAKMPWTLEACYQVQNGTKTVMKIKFPEESLVAGNLKNGKPDVLGLTGDLTNGFDGFNAAVLDLGWLRQVCTNGMVASVGARNLSYRHIGEDPNKKIVDGFREFIASELQNSKQFVTGLTGWDFKDKGGQFRLL